MALGSALVDRAVQLRKAGAPLKVEGRTIHSTATSPPFKCRLDVVSAEEQTRDERTATQPRPMLLCGLKDLEGAALDFKQSDRLRVESRELGTDIWELDAEPKPMRRKRRLIGWELSLHRVVEAVKD